MIPWTEGNNTCEDPKVAYKQSQYDLGKDWIWKEGEAQGWPGMNNWEDDGAFHDLTGCTGE